MDANNIEDVLTQINLPNNGLMYASSSTIIHIKNLLDPIITNEKVVDFILSIRQQNLKESLCFDFFYKQQGNQNPEFSKNLYLRVLATILASPDADDLHGSVFDKIDLIFDESTDADVKAEATDIMLKHYPKRGERLLNILRQDPVEHLINRLTTPHTGPFAGGRSHVFDINNDVIEQETGDTLLTRIRENLKPVQKIIYDDRENVHNTTLNTSIISTCRSLMKMMTSSVTFDEKYKILVFDKDTVESVKIKLLSALNSTNQKKPIRLNQLKIYGDNETEQLQSRMQFKISSDDSATWDENAVVSRFKQSDKHFYKNVMYLNDYLFPEHINRTRNLEKIFIVTNTWLHFISESNPDELQLYLSLTNIENADIIWFNRHQIKRELNSVIESPDLENFVIKVKNHLFPFDDSKTELFKKIKIGTFADMDLHEILNAVWKFIQQHEHKTEMLKRLREELDDSFGVCCSGIAARLVNSIQGFFDEATHPSLKIKIDINDEMKSKLNRLISGAAIEREIDPLYDSDEFKELVNEIVGACSEDIINEFTPEDIIRNGINQENILRLAYELYQLKN